MAVGIFNRPEYVRVAHGKEAIVLNSGTGEGQICGSAIGLYRTSVVPEPASRQFVLAAAKRPIVSDGVLVICKIPNR